MKTILIAFLILSTQGWTQDYGKEIKRILTEFSTLEAYHIEAEVFVSGEEDFSFKASVKTSKYGSRTITDNTEMIINKKFAVAIDHDDKTIRVDRGNYKIKSKGKGDLGLELIDQQINEQGGVEYLGKTSEYRTYVIYQNSTISKTVIKINNKTNFFHEIEVFYNSDEVSIVSYKVKYNLFKRSPKFKPLHFTERLFFKHNSNGTLSPTDAYKEYKVIKQF